MISIGIDPGINGAVAFIDGRSGKASVFDLPRKTDVHRLDGYALAILLRANASAGEDQRVFVEQLHGSSGHTGGAGMAQTGAMMQSVGIILGAVDCTRFPVHMVTPQRWKKSFGLTKDKKGSLAAARQLYPQLQSDLARVKDADRAEALLIAHWGMRSLA